MKQVLGIMLPGFIAKIMKLAEMVNGYPYSSTDKQYVPCLFSAITRFTLHYKKLFNLGRKYASSTNFTGIGIPRWKV